MRQGAVGKFANIVRQIEIALEDQCVPFHNMSDNIIKITWQEKLCSTLMDLTQLLHNDGVISAYEMYSSGLVQALVAVLSKSPWELGINRGQQGQQVLETMNRNL